MTRIVVGVALVAVMLVVTSTAGGQGLDYRLETSVAVGRYGLGERVTTFVLLNELHADLTGWFLDLEVPAVWQNPAGIPFIGSMPAPGMGHMPSGGGSNPGRHDHHGGMGGMGDSSGGAWGLADPTLRAGVVAIRDPLSRFALRVFCQVKAPVASADRGLGTGEWDSGAGIGWSLVSGPWSLQAEASWWNVGRPDGVRLEDVFAYDLAVGRSFSDPRLGFVLGFQGNSGSVPGRPGPSVGRAVVERKTAAQGWFYGGIELGLSSSAPDVALVLGWRTRLR